MPVQVERYGISLPSWSTYQPKLTVKCVCEQCNNGWMSRLENRVRPHLEPLLTGQPRVLDAEAQTTISTWAVKTTMVLEGMDPDAKRNYSQLQRERFRLRASVPWRTSIWLAASAGADLFMSTKNRHMGATSDDSGVSVTMAFGAVVLQVLSMRVPEEVGPNTVVTTHVRRGPWSDTTLQIWPSRGVASWPPLLGLMDEDGLNLFAERFRTSECRPDEIDMLVV
jgi:hypothetical protein